MKLLDKESLSTTQYNEFSVYNNRCNKPQTCSKKLLQAAPWDFRSRVPSLSSFFCHCGTISVRAPGWDYCWSDVPRKRFAFLEPVILGYNHTQVSSRDFLTNWEGTGAMEPLSRSCCVWYVCGVIAVQWVFGFYFLSKCVLHAFKDSKANKWSSAWVA